jgi:integrase/recombinase XerD
MTDTLAGLVDEHMARMAAKNFSALTLKGARSVLGRFLGFMAGIGVSVPERLGTEAVRAWMAHFAGGTVKGLPLNVRTVNNAYCHVRQFLVFMAKRGHVAHGLPDAVEMLREPRFLPRGILPYAKMRRMLAKIDTTTAGGHRDRTLLELLCASGIRAGELRGLNVGDVDFKEGTMKVFGKGRKERMLPVGKTALRFLESYVRAVRPLHLKGAERKALFLSERGGRMSYDALRLVVNRHCRADGVNVTCHTFRSQHLARQGDARPRDAQRPQALRQAQHIEPAQDA